MYKIKVVTSIPLSEKINVILNLNIDIYLFIYYILI